MILYHEIVKNLGPVCVRIRISSQRGLANFRHTGYTYEQFVTPEWRQFVELATRRGGAAAILTNAEQEGYIK